MESLEIVVIWKVVIGCIIIVVRVKKAGLCLKIIGVLRVSLFILGIVDLDKIE